MTKSGPGFLMWKRLIQMALTLLQPDAVKAANIVAAALDRNSQALERFGLLMSQSIQDFSATVNAAFDKIATATDGLASDVSQLNDTIAKLQASEGTITPEDQALLDSIQQRASTVADKLAALDALTTPPTPTT